MKIAINKKQIYKPGNLIMVNNDYFILGDFIRTCEDDEIFQAYDVQNKKMIEMFTNHCHIVGDINITKLTVENEQLITFKPGDIAVNECGTYILGKQRSAWDFDCYCIEKKITSTIDTYYCTILARDNDVIITTGLDTPYTGVDNK